MAGLKVTIKKIPTSTGHKYRVDYYDRSGTRKRPSFATEREAKDFRSLLMQRSLQVGSSDPDRETTDSPIFEAIRRYDELCSQSKTTGREEKKMFEDMYDFLHEQDLYSVQEIKTIHVEMLQKHLRKSVSASRVNRVFNTYRHFFTKCVDWSFIAKNPSLPVKNLASKPDVKRVPSIDEVKVILEKIQPQYGDFLFFMAHTGARNGEVRNLTWADVDFGRKLIILKSRKGTGDEKLRGVPMTEALASFMQERRDLAQKAAQSFDTPIFVNTLGNPIQNSALDGAVREACDAAEMERFTPYALRHAIATAMEEENQGDEKIRMIMGHAPGSRITSNYKHLNVGHLRLALDSTAQAKGLTRSSGHQWAQGSDSKVDVDGKDHRRNGHQWAQVGTGPKIDRKKVAPLKKFLDPKLEVSDSAGQGLESKGKVLVSTRTGRA